MKGRLVDILLIVTLVLVAFGITYTLLTLNRGQTQPPPDFPAQQVQQELPEVPADGRVVPEGLPQPPGTSDLPVIGEEPEEETQADAQDEEPAAPRIEIEGELPLQAIGFSWVTGGAGACGVVLEPWEHVAVSRELLAELGCGAEVTVYLDDPVDGRTSVSATVADTMNPSHSMTVNIYVGEDEPALEYGRNTGALTVP